MGAFEERVVEVRETAEEPVVAKTARVVARRRRRLDWLTPLDRHPLTAEGDILLDGLFHNIPTHARRAAVHGALADIQLFLGKRDDLFAASSIDSRVSRRAWRSILRQAGSRHTRPVTQSRRR